MNDTGTRAGAPASLLARVLGALQLLDVDDFARGLDRQRREGGRFGTCALELGLLDESTLIAALGTALGVATVGVERLLDVPSRTLARLPRLAAERLRCVPFAEEGGRLLVALDDPRDLPRLDQIATICGRAIAPHLALEIRLSQALERHYRIELPPRHARALAQLDRRAALRAMTFPSRAT
ncbi:MAG: hypothetical protein U0X73_01285 [Thermoanaerobaculia bacterium]